MTKADFIEVAKQNGYDNHKDLVEALGYNKRTLDRYKLDKVLTKKFVTRLEEFLAGSKKEVKKEPVKKVEEKKETQVANKKSTKKENKKEEPKDSIGVDISNEEYHSSDFLSTSKIKMIMDNPKEYYLKYVTKELVQDDTEALIIGTIFHSLVLEPEKFNDEYIVLDIAGRILKSDYVNAIEMLGGEVETKINTKKETVVTETIDTLKEKFEALKKKSKKKIITKSQFDLANKLAEKSLNSRLVMETINSTTGEIKTHFDFTLRDVLHHENCITEKTFYGEINGEKVQIRVDLLFNMSKSSNFYIAVDLKSAIDGSEKTFMSQMAQHKYDIQDYIYTEILRQNGINLYEFRFLVAGKDDVSDAMFYTIRRDDIEDTAKVVNKIIDKYKYCKENNLWKSTPFDYKLMRYETTKTLEMPMWAKYKYVDMGVL